MPDQDTGAGGGGAGFELVDEAGLADSGLAGHEREARRPLERAVQQGELVGTADERGAGNAAEHDVHDGGRLRRVPAGELAHRLALTRR